jgi:hypothetical protein
MVYGRYNELVNGVISTNYNWGAPSCMNININKDLNGIHRARENLY